MIGLMTSRELSPAFAIAMADHENQSESSIMRSSKTLLSIKTAAIYSPRVRAIISSVVIAISPRPLR
jgi:hypothetical protein